MKNTQNALCTLAVIAALIFLMCAVRSEEYKKRKCIKVPQREYGAKMCAYEKNWLVMDTSNIIIPDDIVLKTVDMPASDEDEEENKLLRTCEKDPNCFGLHFDYLNGKVKYLKGMPPTVENKTYFKVESDKTSKDLINKFKNSKAKRRSVRAKKAAMKLERAAMESSDN